MGVSAGLAGLGAGLYGMFKGSPSSQVPTYGLQNQAGADYGAYGGIQNLGQYNTYGQNLGQFSNLASQLGQGNPYAGLYQQGAGQAGNLYQGAGLGAYGAGAGAYGAGSNALGAGNTAFNQANTAFGVGGNIIGQGQGMYGLAAPIEQAGLGQLGNVQALMNMGFDPQNALYARQQQQNAQQVAAQNAASGIGSTPYGAGVANLANENFNIDWQNQQLGRAATAAGAAGGLLGNIGGALNTGAGITGQAANLQNLGVGTLGQGVGMLGQGVGMQGQGVGMMGQGANLQNMGAGMYLQGAGLPYQTAQGITGDTMSGLSQLGQFGAGGANMQNQQVQDYLAYLKQGNVNTDTQLAQAKAAFDQSQAMAKGLGQSLGGLGGAWAGMGQPFGSGGYIGPQSGGAQGFNQYAGTSPLANYAYQNNPWSMQGTGWL